MSRSGYDGDNENHWEHILWRGAVASAIRGRRGQAFLKEMLAALDALPEKMLVDGELDADGAVCAIGSVGRARGIDMSNIDPADPPQVAAAFGISKALACEIAFENDEAGGYWRSETPEARFLRVRAWVLGCLKKEP